MSDPSVPSTIRQNNQDNMSELPVLSDINNNAKARPGKDISYHRFSEEETLAIHETFSSTATLQEVKANFDKLGGKISPLVTPEKVHQKIKRSRETPNKEQLSCRRKLSTRKNSWWTFVYIIVWLLNFA